MNVNVSLSLCVIVYVSIRVSDRENILSNPSMSGTDIEPGVHSQNCPPNFFISIGTGPSVFFHSEISIFEAEEERVEKAKGKPGYTSQ